MRSSAILSLAVTTLAGLSFVVAAGGPHHRGVGGRGHRAVIAGRNAKGDVSAIEGVYKREGDQVAKKYRKRGGKTCKVRGTGAKPTSTLSGASSAASSDVASSTVISSSTSSSSDAAPTASGPALAAAILQPASSSASSHAASSTAAWDQWSSSSQQQPSTTSSWSSSIVPTTSTTAAPVPTSAPPANSGLLQATGPCGDAQSSADHPNGAAWWLNCGLNAGGWAPPSVAAHQLISITDPHAYPNVFGACLQYTDIFSDAAAKQNMPTALLMAIGMQESGCKQDAEGSRGEQGIMQVAGNACDNNGDCKEPWYNIHKGAQILVDKMGGDPNGNIISALGQYNGWMPGMQAGDGAQYGPQGQKISYLDDMLNKWLQGKSSY